MRGVILYGPPAAGKDTVTEALHRLDPIYVHFPRLKVGVGRTAGYRMTSAEAIDQRRAAGDIIWENHRYDAAYVIDRSGLVKRLTEHVPVLHLGQADGVEAVIKALPKAQWIVVYLWCPRDVAAERIKARATGDTASRLRAWDETMPIPSPGLTINTAEVSAESAARAIAAVLAG